MSGERLVEAACEVCVLLAGVSGAQLTLVNGTGRGEPRYTTNATGGRLENLRFLLGEGPAEDALRSGVPVLVAELDSPENRLRWPLFVPAACAAGASAVFVFPLCSGVIQIGALALHRYRPGPLTTKQVLDVRVLAEVILSLALDELARLHFDSRAEVHQATGMLSVQLGVSMEEALTRLRGHAFAHDQPVVEVAHDVVARRLRLSPGTAPGPV
ncbi:GAF and ANTAR domain-containing protein [Lentzea sp. NEAU-D13]|uniref:GAF and ANTAR domain-containing protein n=1 Tax=Lentzea alba TaxID=2714351 RepID=A0A7C9W0W1_9PSEU|nr:GAF and ANTAR domain-containing protein [Lentzea alba]NGY61300.1 GAF and ANTAR domain-containing protein [Lentzea alba]